MDEVIEKQVSEIFKGISGFSLSDQFFIVTEMAERLKRYGYDCLAIEYGLMEETEC
jgi:hypothetical protein